jgi:hypothetical protein
MNTRVRTFLLRSLLLLVTALMFTACESKSDSGPGEPPNPSITSIDHAVFVVGTAGTFTVTAIGSPAPTFALNGALPAGVTFDSATGILSGTPGGGTSGVYWLIFTALNGVAPDATQTFTLAVASTSTSVLIVHDGTAGIEADVVANLTTKLTTAGYTATANIGIPTGSLANFRQIWDVRFNNTTPLSGAESASYMDYLDGGGTLFVIGENTGFATRNNTIVILIDFLGGGFVTLATPANAQTVQPPFTLPTALSSVTFLAAAGTADPVNGAFITKDVNNVGAAIFYDRGTLSNAPGGRLVAVFDINFLQAGAAADMQTLTDNLIAIP